MIVRFSQLRGQRVLARENAQLVGSVRRLLLDQPTVSVSGAQLEGVVGDATILPWSSVAAVGPDALMIEAPDVLQSPTSEIEEDIRRGTFDLEGKQVLSELGDSLGHVEDVEFDERSGRLLRLDVPGHALPLERFVAIGPHAVILPVPR